MEITSEMISAAVKQAVKDKLLPAHLFIDEYTHFYESVERMIMAALDKEGQ